MSATQDRIRDTPLPSNMRDLPRDSRGYPIPFIVFRDREGVPQFTINDERRTERCRLKRLCSICGKAMLTEVWFIGGSRCFLHPQGAFVDPPMHLECATYALTVCPFLAARRYTGRIDERKLKPESVPEGMTIGKVEHMPPALPERFGLGRTRRYHYQPTSPGQGLYVVDSWAYVEFWKNGAPCPPPDTMVPPPLPDET